MTTAQSIYIHLPFCKTKCPYCDFASSTIKNTKTPQEYIKMLLLEIELRSKKVPALKPIKTIFFGGGTPSIHSANEIELILSKLASSFTFDPNIEITLEANPGTIDKEKLKEFQSISINRISLGVQSFDEVLLDKLGRGHSLQDTYQALEDILSLGFNSWSMDLIYGLPHQSLDSWKQTIEKALSYKPPHISAYALSIEENTPYGHIYGNSQHKDLPKEESVVSMYRLANEKFEEEKIYRYEISNWAKSGHEARHNLTYWNAKEYYAFGISAHGYLNQYRYCNSKDLNKYLALSQENLDFIEDSKELINEQESLKEQILLKLRLNNGLILNDQISKHLNFQKLQEFADMGLVEKAKKDPNKSCKLDNIKLSLEGVLLSNKVIAELIK